MCAGYEGGRWRAEQLAGNLMYWLPEFALKHSERAAIGDHNMVELLARAARSTYKSPKYQKRGELGELLLHAVVREVFDTIPAIAKLFYKDGPNDTVKGFDLVHVVATPTDLELWLGEVKFYSDIAAAIRDVVAELHAHVERDYLRGEFAAITNKIDDAWPHAEKLKKLLDETTSLDQVFSCTCVPVLLTYDSPTVSGHRELCDAYRTAFEAEVFKHAETFASKSLPTNVRIELLLVPLGSKADLVKSFDEKLKHAQKII
jgi:hypothetical protein